MYNTEKFKKAKELLSVRLKCEEEYIEDYLRQNPISPAKVYKGLAQMGYVWTGEGWIRMYSLPEWYIRMRSRI